MGRKRDGSTPSPEGSAFSRARERVIARPQAEATAKPKVEAVAKPKPPTKTEIAERLILGFWGHSSGDPAALKAAAIELSELDLSLNQISELRADLPLGGAGTTGDRVRRVDRVLKRLEHGAK